MVIMSMLTTSYIFITLTGLTNIYVEIGSKKLNFIRRSTERVDWWAGLDEFKRLEWIDRYM
jgi:hypothetical protein